MFLGLLTTAVCMYRGALQMRCAGLMCEISAGGSAVFMMKTVGGFKMETRRKRNRDLTTQACELNGVSVTLTIATLTLDKTEM